MLDVGVPKHQLPSSLQKPLYFILFPVFYHPSTTVFTSEMPFLKKIAETRKIRTSPWHCTDYAVVLQCSLLNIQQMVVLLQIRNGSYCHGNWKHFSQSHSAESIAQAGRDAAEHDQDILNSGHMSQWYYRGVTGSFKKFCMDFSGAYFPVNILAFFLHSPQDCGNNILC